jgi:hypothetical protein
LQSESQFFRRAGSWAWRAIEVLILGALILTTRCANYQDVLIAGNVYFSDADCYARMMRVRMCAEDPGLIVRHHDFENYPTGTTPHTTAPLDYLIVTLAALLRRWTAQPLDVAGALISPFLALLSGWFLWWWSRQMKFTYRWVTLILYSISPILVHGTELGRPDHQSLLMLLITIAVCAEWTVWSEPSKSWGVVSGLAWGLAIWVSAYEPLILFVLTIALSLLLGRAAGAGQGVAAKDGRFFSPDRRPGWIVFAAIVGVFMAFCWAELSAAYPIAAGDYALVWHSFKGRTSWLAGPVSFVTFALYVDFIAFIPAVIALGTTLGSF